MKSATLEKICCLLAELIATAMLVFLGCMGCIKNSTFSNSDLQMNLTFGLVVMILVQSFGCVSGAHLNPSVTLGAFIHNLLSLPMTVGYMASQLLGGFIGYGLLKLLVPSTAVKLADQEHGVCVTVPHAEINLLQAVAVEFILTGMLVLVCCAVWDPRNTKYGDSVAIRIGLTVACLALSGGPFTGASMNPARSFAAAVWNTDFEAHWVYWVGPLCGGAVFSLLYKTIFRREVAEDTTNGKVRAMEEVPFS